MRKRVLIWVLVLVLLAAAVFAWIRLGNKPQDEAAEGETPYEDVQTPDNPEEEQAEEPGEGEQTEEPGEGEQTEEPAEGEQTGEPAEPEGGAEDASGPEESKEEREPSALKRIEEFWKYFRSLLNKLTGPQLIEDGGDITIIVPEGQESDGF